MRAAEAIEAIHRKIIPSAEEAQFKFSHIGILTSPGREKLKRLRKLARAHKKTH